MSEWKEYSLGEISNFSYGKMPDKKLLGRGHYPTFSGYKYQHQYPKKNISKGDVIVVARGVGGTGDVKLVKKDSYLTNLSIKFDLDSSVIRNDFFYYLFQITNLKHLDSGSAQSQITITDLKNIKIQAPPLQEQKAIAHILGTLDYKIELNRQMNQTLEAMAQALFKSWFVDFDPVMDNALAEGNEIPNELQTMAEKRQLVKDAKKLLQTNPYLAAQFPSAFVYNEVLRKWVPEGWEVKSLSKIIKLIGGGTPKTSIEEYWNGDIPWFSVVDAPNDSDVFVIDTEKKVSYEGVKNSSTQILREGTTIISARGTVGKCAMVGVPMAMNQSCYGIQSLNSNEDIFTYLLVLKNVSDLQNKSHGSVFSTITRDTFSAIDAVLPMNRNNIQEFESSLKYNFEKIKSNLFENQTLIQLRDRVLPELISGRVRVSTKEQTNIL